MIQLPGNCLSEKNAGSIAGKMFMGAARTMLMLMWAVSDARGNRSRGTEMRETYGSILEKAPAVICMIYLIQGFRDL